VGLVRETTSKNNAIVATRHVPDTSTRVLDNKNALILLIKSPVNVVVIMIGYKISRTSY